MKTASSNPVSTLWLALALSLAAAVSLGITRFSYGLLLPPMRADLGWTYTLAGAMNTANALGYLLGALAMPQLLRYFGPTRLVLGGAVLASGLMALTGFFTESPHLLAQRLLAGIASALVFSAGGLLAARLAAIEPQKSGFLLGIYYGGVGVGIVVSALVVPSVLDAATAQAHGWAWACWVLAGACAVGTALVAWPTRVLASWAAQVTASELATPPKSDGLRFAWRDFGFALGGYGLFGLGYIGYMTFVIALLKEQGASASAITTFYALLGLACVVSARLWAGLLDHFRGGQALAILNALLGLATVLPAITSVWPVVLLSGILFGAVFASVVASTTALVRHNLPASQWAPGISAFTVVFAAGQMVGPTAVGWIADGPGGLPRGLLFSAIALWLGALLAWRQRGLARG